MAAQDRRTSDAHGEAWPANLPPMLTRLLLDVPDLGLWDSLDQLRDLEALTLTVPPNAEHHQMVSTAGPLPPLPLPPPPRLPASLTSLTLLNVNEPSEGFASRVRSWGFVL